LTCYTKETRMLFLLFLIFALSFAYLVKAHPYLIKYARTAIIEDRPKLLEMLLFIGLDPDIFIKNDDGDDDDSTLLHYAATYGFERCVNVLLSYNVNVDEVCKYYSGRTAMQLAVRQGYMDIVNSLIDFGADINFKDELRGETALHIAAFNGYLQIMHLLLLRGAQVNAVASGSGLTPLMHACEYGNDDMVKLLLEFGADVNINTDEYAIAEFPTNALYIATSNVHVEIQKMLLASGASIVQECENGDVITAFTEAEPFHEIFDNLDNWPTTMFLVMMDNYGVTKTLDFASIQDFMEFSGKELL
jgi:ankyrin repeat protein